MTSVSIGLPIYNAAKYLEESLSSLVAQTHEDLEIVISDNASTDETEEICRRFADLDPRIRYIRQPLNRGAAFNHNFVAAQSTGDYFRWYSYDDRLDPRCVEVCARALDDNPELVLSWPETFVIDETSEVVDRYRTDLPWDNHSPSSRMRSLLSQRADDTLLDRCYPIYGLMRRTVLRSCMPMGSFSGSDTVILVEMALRGPWQQVPERLFYNRRHAESSVPGRTVEEIAHWMNPGMLEGRSMPETHKLLGYLRAIQRAPLSRTERLRCVRIVALWIPRYRRWRVIGGELKIRSRLTVHTVIGRFRALGAGRQA